MNYQDKILEFDLIMATEYKNAINALTSQCDFFKPSVPDSLPNSLKAFYSEIVSFEYKWETKQLLADGNRITGSINILPAKTVMGSWEGSVYFGDDDEFDASIKQFKVVDLFVEEACVGFIKNKSNPDLLYYLDFGSNQPVSLGVDFNGYFELMLAARGFWYWQLALIHIKNKQQKEPAFEVEQFKTYMPQIFPDFKWEEFVALYEKVRIK